jgi:hypothetical protein
MRKQKAQKFAKKTRTYLTSLQTFALFASLYGVSNYSALNQSLFFSDFDSASNAFEVFDGYRPRADFQGFVHDSIRG